MRTAFVFLLAVFSLPTWASSEFTLTDLDGNTHRLSDYRGKWVVVNYWATWCPPCLQEIPELVQFHERHKDSDAVVLGINMESIEPELLRGFVEDNFVNYPVLQGGHDPQGVGNIPGLPTTYLVGPDGKPVARQVGAITAESIERFIDKQKRREQ